MILFFRKENGPVLAVKTSTELNSQSIEALEWLFSDAKLLPDNKLDGTFKGPRREMITPWSTTAVEITQNMNIQGIERIEEFIEVESSACGYDKMLQRIYQGLSQEIFDITGKPHPVIDITDIKEYNQSEGLALSDEEIEYLEQLSKKLNRPLTDGEVFGFSQVNSEHCRHKIFNGKFIIDGVEMESTLFQLIKKSSQLNPNRIVSAYKDNCAFIEGPVTNLFFPESGSTSSFFKTEEHPCVLSLKAETHNFPTTVEPFNGAATGSGGEIRDRMAGGKGSFPIAGTAVYMTSYPRPETEGRDWESVEPREWLYQTPQEILIKASNGASDYGNKFGQPLICGSLLTFEHMEGYVSYAFDKVIMLAGGVGYAKKQDAFKDIPGIGDKVVLLGGDNYRIGMGGGAVSSVATGEYDNLIELNAIQRSNPEMQKRVYNAIRSLAERGNNTIISIHDHGAGGHLNCLSELVEHTGGYIDISKLPAGDPTLSARELIGNESQERMGLVIRDRDVDELIKIAERERAPIYVIGETTGEGNFTLENSITKEKPLDLPLSDMFGSVPKTVMEDVSFNQKWDPVEYDTDDLEYYLHQVLQLESVACKDWLTNKVDRSVTGLIASQQTTGEIQLPLNNLGVAAVGYGSTRGVATSIGHAPAVALIDPAAGSRMAIAESLTNIIWTPVEGGIRGVSLSANWMWPCKNLGEDAKLYKAVKAASDFAIELGINIPTGKDSMSMTQKYPDDSKVLSPGTLIVSTVAESMDITNIVRTSMVTGIESHILYIPFNHLNNNSFTLGGSAFAQVTNQLGNECPDITNPAYFRECFEAVQRMIENRLVIAGHDVSAGGIITALLELNFPNISGGIAADVTLFDEKDPARILFSEDSGVILQVNKRDIAAIENIALEFGIVVYNIGVSVPQRKLTIKLPKNTLTVDIDQCRDIWYKTSYLFDKLQLNESLALERYRNYSKQPLKYKFPETFNGKSACNPKKYVAAIIREKGSNGDREMAWSLHLAGFAVKDVHMTDLVSGREDLKDVNIIVFTGGFSNADTLGSAKGWAGAFLYNKKAAEALDNFYNRNDTLSLGVCNGCQLMAELGLINRNDSTSAFKMGHNQSHKFESGFVGVTIAQSPSVMLSSLNGASLGIWVAHGEGRFLFSGSTSKPKIALTYNYPDYPANPNGSMGSVAGVCSSDGRHLAMMPHPERCLYPHNWAYYPHDRKDDLVTPWLSMFENARQWFDIIFSKK